MQFGGVSHLLAANPTSRSAPPRAMCNWQLQSELHFTRGPTPTHPRSPLSNVNTNHPAPPQRVCVEFYAISTWRVPPTRRRFQSQYIKNQPPLFLALSFTELHLNALFRETRIPNPPSVDHVKKKHHVTIDKVIPLPNLVALIGRARTNTWFGMGHVPPIAPRDQRALAIGARFCCFPFFWEWQLTLGGCYRREKSSKNSVNWGWGSIFQNIDPQIILKKCVSTFNWKLFRGTSFVSFIFKVIYSYDSFHTRMLYKYSKICIFERHFLIGDNHDLIDHL